MSNSVAVIIPTYNYGRFISQAIESVLSQSRLPEEVIVVDDGSTDDTQQVVARFGDAVTYVRQENAGVSAGRNRGVRESTGEYIAFLDADDMWETTKLEKQLAMFAEDDSIGLVHCGMREFDDKTGVTIQLHLEGGEEGVDTNLLLWDGPVIVGPGGTIMVSRKAFDSVNGFDTRMKVGEDWDFCYRVAKKFKVGFVPEALVNYRRHGSAAHLTLRDMERGMSVFYEKAFADTTVLHLRRRAYGNFHKVMAGSYFHSGEYAMFISHSLKSIWMRPANLLHFLMFPVRFSRRKNRSLDVRSNKHA